MPSPDFTPDQIIELANFALNLQENEKAKEEFRKAFPNLDNDKDDESESENE